ncbi:tryptophan synthase subunit alpha [Candidatus Latescibacterota bacterium]
MGRIEKRFEELHGQGRKAFIAYITAGDPSLDATISLVMEFEKAGVDIIELGIPFSDPIADGPVNQEAAQRALKNGVNIGKILNAVREIRKSSQVPVIFFTYLNTILAYGLERFADDAADSGVDGVLVLDLPPEEAGEYKRIMDSKNIDTIFLISPITPDDRLEIIVHNTTGFVYYVSQMGVTGERDRVADNVSVKIHKIRSKTIVPVVVGFGISSPEQVKEIAGYGDGVVVGSSIVKRIGKLGVNPGFEKEVAYYVKKLTKPLKGI